MEQLSMMPARIRIASVLRKAIYAGEYKSGDELSLTDVAAQLGISRTPVREAFQELEAEGLITLRMNRGAVVNTIDRKFIRDTFEMRRLLESEAVARAAGNGMETEQLLNRLYDLRDHITQVSKETYEALNQDIHTAIWKAADNRRLEKCLLDMWNGPSVAGSAEEVLEHYRNSTFEHISILQFIRDGMAEEARRAMELHITRSMTNMLQCYPEEGK
ncbi:MAG: GntR family transcriptional regulator [Clostridia bacterium]|nr:GntR family transcriptional regulator [Clostridia bacterium]